MSIDQATPAPLRLLELLRVLREYGVDHLVIGGVAVAAHGSVRGTKDVDIIPEPSRANLARLVAALNALDARQDGGDLRPDEMPVELDLDGLLPRR